MKLNKNFHLLFFQASLAAGGVALMPFNYLQFAIPNGKGLVKFSDIIWTNLSGMQAALYSALIAIMLITIIAHIVLTMVFVKGLVGWLANKKAASELLNDPYKNVTIFPIIGSLAMSANVFWAPIGFFVPQVSSGLQSLMFPSLIYFAVLWSALFALELKVISVWFTKSIETTNFNFVWLLDVFAFGLVSLTGSGIAIASGNAKITGIAVAGTVITSILGLFMLYVKLVHLIITQLKARELPDIPILPAFFIVVPISCLYGLSLFRLTSYFQKYLSTNLSGISSFIISASYVIAVAWLILTVYMLVNYFKSQFLTSKYSAPQWGMVCALVGSQVLGVYVQGLYIHNSYLEALNYFSIILAVITYSLIIVKFIKSLSPVKSVS